MNEDNVIDGVINYLNDKNRQRDSFRVIYRSYAKDGDHGIDLKCAAYSGKLIFSGKGATSVHLLSVKP